MCINESESYDGDSIVIRGITHAGQVKGEKPNEKRYICQKNEGLLQ